ncbi:MAG: NUDIX domain-containing protein [Rhizobacter sp.]|nr:NUDIX domain-containing protein [Rhizobacter sp.]
MKAPRAAGKSRRGAETIICTVDVVLLSLLDDSLHVALLKREREPFSGALALPGGEIKAGVDLSAWDAAARMLKAKTGVQGPYLEQLATFSGPGRDPRGWSISVAYCALVSAELLQNAGSALHVVPVNRLPALPFDHRSIINVAVTRVRSKSQYSSLPVYLCGNRFTLPQLQSVYEAVLGEAINKVSFRRKMDELGMLEPISGAFEVGRANRPAQLYQLRRAFRRRLSLLERAINAGH